MKTIIPTFYLPLSKFHIVPINSLSPTELKRSAKKTECDREKISHNTKLNAIAKILGFSGGFSSYQESYEANLLPFMDANRFKKRKNLVGHKYPCIVPCGAFTHQQVSERLFFSDHPLPKKLFTGYDFDFISLFNKWHALDLIDLLKSDHDWQQIIKGEYHARAEVDDTFEVGALPLRQQELLRQDLFSQPASLTILGTPTTLKIIEIILLHNRWTGVGSSFHLLGNNLTGMPDNKPEIQLYNIEESSLQVRCVRYIKSLLNIRFQHGKSGWVDVIPFNKNLIFLSDRKGNYDFVIKNQRTRVFDHQIFGDNLKRSDIPSFMENYRFQRWYYYEYQGHRDLDSHHSEQLHYSEQNESKGYLGQEVILQEYYKANKSYVPQVQTSSKHLKGFKETSLSEKTLMVSELITIEDLEFFLANDEYYKESRKGDSIKPVNSDVNLDLPASVTFYDALAYINWRESEQSIPLRLLSFDEYTEIRKLDNSDLKSPNFDLANSILRFLDLEDKPFESHPPYREDFDLLPLCYKENLPYLSCQNLNFVDSDFFAEWLLEGASVRSASLTSFYGGKHVLAQHERGPLDSTGKYKHIKIGFRLCYELTKH